MIETYFYLGKMHCKIVNMFQRDCWINGLVADVEWDIKATRNPLEEDMMIGV
jgi:hypothetical protein